MSRPVIAIYRPVDGAQASHDRLSEAGCDVLVEPLDLQRPNLSQTAAQSVVLMGATFRGGVMDAAWFDQFPQLRLVSKYTIGFDDVDLQAASQRGIAVTHCPTEANWGGVAEGALGMMLTVLKKLRERDRAVRDGGWRDASLLGRYVGRREDGYEGLTIGIVGLGRVGRRLAGLLRPWGVRLMAADPYVPADVFAEHAVEQADLDAVLRESDVLSIHCALTPETRNLINASALAKMKPGALLINTARGAIVDFTAVLQALDADSLGCAALDVFPEEPIPDVDSLARFGDRLLLSPHMVAANDGGTLLAAVPWATDAALHAVRGIYPERVVNADVQDQWEARFGGHDLLDSHLKAAQ